MRTEDARPAARVLVVEDDRNIRELIALHLRLEGFEPVTIGENDFDNLLIVSGGSLIRLHY